MKKSLKFLMMFLVASYVFSSCKKSKKDDVVKEPDTEKELVTKTPTEAPATLFLIVSPDKTVALTKTGSTFSTPDYVSLQAGESYSFNTKADGKGTEYCITEPLSAFDYADDDKVEWEDPLLQVVQGKSKFTVARTQAYKLSIDFSSALLTWQYHNIKLFYYTVWEEKQEVLLNYKHPFMFEKTLALPADNNMKFYSINPEWYEWGSETETTLTGALIRGGGKDIVAVKEAGSYKVNITLNNKLENGTYSFVNQ